MESNSDIVEAFFLAYREHDSGRMCERLAPDATFSDLAFPSLTGEPLRNMWRWFCAKTDQRGPIEMPAFEITASAGDRVDVRYRVVYQVDGRQVDYWIRSALTVIGGRIVEQDDQPESKFLFAWQVAGFPKCLFAYTKKFDRKLQQRMAESLAARASAGMVARAH
jgi:ketosteroid isomerase-like protein